MSNTNNKFYRSKDFIELQSKWYDILKQNDFTDIEWYDDSTGKGASSPYLKNSMQKVTSMKEIDFIAFTKHFEIVRNFLAHGPFAPKIAEKYSESFEIQCKFSTLQDFAASFDKTYTSVEYKIMQMYSKGFTVQEISKELRKLHSSGVLPAPRFSRKGKKPFSVNYVHPRLAQLKADAYRYYLDNKPSESSEYFKAYKELASMRRYWNSDPSEGLIAYEAIIDTKNKKLF